MNAAASPLQDNQILLPVARIVQGDLYDPQTEDMQGNLLTIKSGNNAGQNRVNYFFALAIPKKGEQIWWQTPWGAKIYQIAQTSWPTWFDRVSGVCTHPKFAWKIGDGDDLTPNPDAQNRRNCDREGFPGHWIARLGSGFATKIFDESGRPLLQPGLVKRGYWAEVLIAVNSNSNAQKPGLYLNHNMVAYRAPGKEILAGPDPMQIGFGRSELPAGVTAQPLGNTANMPAPSASTPAYAPPPAFTPPAAPVATSGYVAPVGVPPVPGAAAAPAYAPPAAPAPVAAAPTAVQPQAAFIQPPPAPAYAPPAAPAATPPSVVCPLGAPMGYKMSNLNGARYDAFRASNWTDAALVQAGHMVRL